ncbi:MAG: enoyl-CoA hydratase/isomerase family protein [Clostridia bacterium]|nr:enoyl-CoA hydratase/isomerase family protein [Clostridia bacterium]
MPKVKTSRNPLMIPTVPFEEYSKKYSKLFQLERTESGVVMAKWHTDGKSAVWDQPLHRAIHQLTSDVGQDVETEVFILGGAGHDWLAQIHSTEAETPDSKKWLSYEHMFYDGCNICEGLIFDLEIPTIGVINGPGFHTEMALFCDITLMADDATIVDPHFHPANMVPGDGIQIAFRECMGLKRANYAMLTCETIGPEKALQYGLVNEVVPKDKIYERAMELAELFASKPRMMRRATVQVLRQPWKEALAKELRLGFGTEMWTYLAGNEVHDGGGGEQDKLMASLGADM